MLDRAALAALGVDDAVVERRRLLDGERAVGFLTGLPELVAHWQRQFGLSGARLQAGGALSAVLACRRIADDRPVMLKLSAPEAHSARAEASALAAWNGHGACALLAASDDATALVLEAVLPGVAVEPTGERADARAAGELLALLHRADAHATGVPDGALELGWRFGRAREWIEQGRAVSAVSAAELDAAARAAREQHQTGGRSLCHGDFLDKNLLVGQQGRWQAIDPMPCIGDPCLDAAFWALHHRPGIEVRERCKLVAAAAGLDAQRVWRWALAFAAAEAVLDIDPERAEGHLHTLRG